MKRMLPILKCLRKYLQYRQQTKDEVLQWRQSSSISVTKYHNKNSCRDARTRTRKSREKPFLLSSWPSDDDDNGGDDDDRDSVDGDDGGDGDDGDGGSDGDDDGDDYGDDNGSDITCWRASGAPLVLPHYRSVLQNLVRLNCMD